MWLHNEMLRKAGDRGLGEEEARPGGSQQARACQCAVDRLQATACQPWSDTELLNRRRADILA